MHYEVVINKINSDTKEGGDWSTDIQKAVNMFCFTMRVHSNLVGSVPGKTQSNNSGCDKRELYTIAQAIERLRLVVVAALQGNVLNVPSLRDIVDFMRKHDAQFPEFRQSATYKLFEPPIFEN